jgi:hypothetical protein
MKKNIKLNQKGIAHHLLLIVLAVLVVGAIGFAGYRIYSNKKLDAQAAGWKTVWSNDKLWAVTICSWGNSDYRFYVRNYSPKTLKILTPKVIDRNNLIESQYDFTVAPRTKKGGYRISATRNASWYGANGKNWFTFNNYASSYSLVEVRASQLVNSRC